MPCVLGDCLDNDGDRVFVEEELLCDGIDEDCDGQVDEPYAVGQVCDGLGVCGNGHWECAGPEAAVCDVAPGGSDDRSSPEVCDSEDNDCDGNIDEDDGQGQCSGCGAPAEFQHEIAPSLWACVNDANISSYEENFSMCADGFTPVTHDMVVDLELRIPTQAEHTALFDWYDSVDTTGNRSYIRTGQKRRGGCALEDHGELYVSRGNGFQDDGGWIDLFEGSGSCEPNTHAANSVHGHPLAGVVCSPGEYEPPHR